MPKKLRCPSIELCFEQAGQSSEFSRFRKCSPGAIQLDSDTESDTDDQKNKPKPYKKRTKKAKQSGDYEDFQSV